MRAMIGLRSYAQRNPLNEFKTEAFSLFERMMDNLRGEVTRQLMLIRFERAPAPPQALVAVQPEESEKLKEVFYGFLLAIAIGFSLGVIVGEELVAVALQHLAACGRVSGVKVQNRLIELGL